jgi:UMF1 family MFS transporter
MAEAAEPLPMTAAEAAAHEATIPAHTPAGWLGQLSWALGDGSRSPYNVLVNIFVFSAYFSTVVVADPVKGQTTWSFLTSASALIIALTAPILGAIADAGGRRKPWLAFTLLFGAPSMLATWWAIPHMTTGPMTSQLMAVMVPLIVAGVSFEYWSVFCNAMLPNVAPKGRLGFLSGLGFSLGNAMGILVFVFFLFAWSWNSHPLFGLDNARHEPERAVGVLSAIWFAVFALPLFLFTPDSAGSGRSIPAAVSQGLRQLGGTITKIGHYKNLGLFLISRMIYNEGFIALMLFTGVFAAGILKWDARMLAVEGLINSVVAALAGLFAGWLDLKIGSKRATIVFVLGCLVANLVIFSVTPTMVFFMPIDPALTATGGLYPTLPDKVFLIAQCSIAFFVTGGLVTSRSMMAKLSPREMLNEFFGIYSMSGTATSFVGPAAIGVVTAAFQSQRAGVLVGIGFLLVGLLIMFPVRDAREA